MRTKDKTLKTQIRFGETDIEVYTKKKGTQEPFRYVALDKIVYLNEIPAFDHSRKWTKRQDRPPRRRVFSSNQSPPTSRKQRNIPPSRQNSTTDNPSKKSRTESPVESSDSSDSSDMDETEGDPLANSPVGHTSSL